MVDAAGFRVSTVAMVVLGLVAWVSWRVLAPPSPLLGEGSPGTVVSGRTERMRGGSPKQSLELDHRSRIDGRADTTFAAHLRGDRRLQLGLVPAFAMPIVCMRFGLILGHMGPLRKSARSIGFRRY
jgi:hypothetical protein